jgi:uncharacterized protein (DUF486 family)
MRTILLLTISNIFMTFAWYGHLKYRSEALWKVIAVSWGIAFFEYCFQVPANRIGSYEFSTAQLKTIQEVITLSVFAVFSVLYLGEKLKWNHAAGFGCLVLGVFFVSTNGKRSRKLTRCGAEPKRPCPAAGRSAAAVSPVAT